MLGHGQTIISSSRAGPGEAPYAQHHSTSPSLLFPVPPSRLNRLLVVFLDQDLPGLFGVKKNVRVQCIVLLMSLEQSGCLQKLFDYVLLCIITHSFLIDACICGVISCERSINAALYSHSCLPCFIHCFVLNSESRKVNYKSLLKLRCSNLLTCLLYCSCGRDANRQ